MQDIEFVLRAPVLFTVLIGIVGLMVGSFLNVVIYRLPLMMQKDWRQQCIAYLELEKDNPEKEEPFNLMFPLSRCPQCKTPIKPHQNIPVLSFLVLKGRCAECNAPISPVPHHRNIYRHMFGLCGMAFRLQH